MSRYIWYIVSFLVVNSNYTSLLYSGRWKRLPIPILHCHSCPLSRFGCPIGNLQHFMVLRQFPYLIVGYFGVLGLILGRWFCGHLCLFGLLQEWLGKLVHHHKRRVSNRWCHVKLISLILIVLIPVFTYEVWFCKLCPEGTLTAGIPQVMLDHSLRMLVGTLFWVKIVLLGLLVVLAIPVKRPFCRFICPLGYIWGIFNRLSLLRIKVDRTRCTECGICEAECPMGLRVYEDTNAVDCIKCGKCIRVCPNGALTMGFMT